MSADYYDGPVPEPESAPVEPSAPLAPVSPRGVQVTGASVLDEVRAWLGRFICTMHDADLDLLALWCAHTHLCVETYTSPRLILDSPVPGSGKTTVLEHFERLCHRPVQMASLSSPALLTRMLDAGMRTILIDEADRSLNPDKEGVSDLLAVLNSGYKRGGTRPVLTPTKYGWRVSEMPTYSPVVMAGNNPQLPDDTKSRSIRVLLLPDIEGRVEESDWELIDSEARYVGGRLAAWADGIRDEVRLTRPPLPDGVKARAWERWSPMKRIATIAGGRWPDVVDDLATKDVEQLEMDREDGMVREKPAVALLAHINELWPTGETFVPTADLLRWLVDEHPDTWGDGSPFGKALTAQRLGRMLATSYKVNSTRLDREGPRGYARAALQAPMRRLGIVPVRDLHGEPSLPPRGIGRDGDTSSAPVSGGVPNKPAQAAQPVKPAHTFTPPTGPGRCPDCGFHVQTQGHRAGCEAA